MGDARPPASLTMLPRDAAGRVKPFPHAVAACHAMNASPYLIDLQQFRAECAAAPHRQALLVKLLGVIERVRELGAHPLALLVGGSFLLPEPARPKDLDGVLFYRCQGGADIAPDLLALWQTARAGGIDVRLVPYDANPLVTLKVCGFFSMLYARTRESDRIQRGCVLVDLTGDAK
jgi:hypothetical protein